MIIEWFPTLLLMALSGTLAGLMAGLFGVGGGAIMVPVLAILFGSLGFETNAMHCAVATSLAVIIVTSSRSLFAHNKRGAVDWHILKTWAPAVIGGAILGMVAVRYASTETLRIVFAGFAIFASAQFFFGRPNWKLREDLPKGPSKHFLAGGLGGLSALIGIGGGTFGVTLMTLCGRPIHQAVGTASGLGVLIGLPSALIAIILGQSVPDRPDMSLGYVNLPAFSCLALGSVFMAPIGANMAHRLDAKLLRRAFAIMLALVAARMLL